MYLPNMVAPMRLWVFLSLFYKSNLFTYSTIWEFHQHISIVYLLLIILLHFTITESNPYLHLNFKACFCSSILDYKFIFFYLFWVRLRRLVLESWPWVQWGLDLAHLPAFKFPSGVASHSNYISNKSNSLYKSVLTKVHL